MDELEAELSAVFETEATDRWMELLVEQYGLPVGPLHTAPEALDNEYVDARRE